MSASRALLVAATLLGSCGHPPGATAPPVPVEGSRRDLRSLEGEWTGEFVNAGGGRRGQILFVLGAGRDTAHAQVVLEGAPLSRGCTDAVSTAARVAEPGGSPTRLRLGSVVVAEGSVAGWLQSYPDFERGCPVDTWFEGRLVRDTLWGMFFAHPLAGDTVRQGIWWAARQP